MPRPVLRPVFLLTDFGLQDAYVGVMKAVLRGFEPQVSIDDLCHWVDPQDLSQAAYQLFTALPYLPASALTVAVVDPGVGTDRRVLLHRWGDRLFLSPDNGLVRQAFEFLAAWGQGPPPEVAATPVAQEEIVRARLGSSPFPSTFDGRDLFMPLAARYAPVSAPLPEFVPVMLDPSALLPPREPGGAITARILLYDRFGNGITNLPLVRWPYSPPFRQGDEVLWRIRWGESTASQTGEALDGAGVDVPFVSAYGAGPEERPFALCDSSGLLELAVKNGSFREFAQAHADPSRQEVVRLIPAQP